MAGEVKDLKFSEGVSVSSPFAGGAGGSGSGEVNFVENNNGLSDLDQTSTDDIGDWLDSGTGITSSITVSSSEIPRSPFQTTAIKLNNDGSSTGYTQIRFEVPVADRNKKLKIEWAQLVGAAFVTGDFALELYNYADNYATGETAVSLHGSSDIPAQNGVYYNEFDADNRQYYELRIVRVAGGATATHFMSINDFIVGPGKLHSGAVVTAWESFTPTFNNLSQEAANRNGRWRRVGESMEVEAIFRQNTGAAGANATNITMTIPEGKSIKTGAGGISSASISGLGFWRRINSTALADGTNNQVEYNSATTVKFRKGGATTHFQDVDLGSGHYVSLNFEVPIAEWAGSGVLNTITQDNVSEWKDFTPEWTNVTVGNGTAAGQWRRNGPDIEVVTSLALGSTTAFSGTIAALLPNSYTPISTPFLKRVGTARYSDGGTPANNQESMVYLNGTTIQFATFGSGNNVTATSPFTWATGDTLRYDFRVPIVEFAGSQSSLVGFSHATEEQNGLVKRNKWQRQTLAADVSATAADVSATTSNGAFKFENLTIGKTYRVTVQASFIIPGTSSTEIASLDVVHNSTTLARNKMRTSTPGGANEEQSSSSVTQFVATATTVTFSFSETGTTVLRGNGDYTETWAMIEELDNYGAESSEF